MIFSFKRSRKLFDILSPKYGSSLALTLDCLLCSQGVCLRHEKRLSAEEATRRGGSLRTSDWQDIEECIDEE